MSVHRYPYCTMILLTNCIHFAQKQKKYCIKTEKFAYRKCKIATVREKNGAKQALFASKTGGFVHIKQKYTGKSVKISTWYRFQKYILK